jgi:hypothetical protein
MIFIPFFQEFIISLAFTKKRAKALTIRMEMAMVMIVTAFRNLWSRISFMALLQLKIMGTAFKYLLFFAYNPGLDE